MIPTPPTQQLLKVECLLGGLLALPRDVHQLRRRQDDAVAPLNGNAVARSADDPHVAAHNFGVDVGHEIFFQTKRIGRCGRLFVHSHSLIPRKSLASREYEPSGDARKNNSSNPCSYLGAQPRVRYAELRRGVA